MRFSLIIGTLDRVESIKSCMKSLENQTFKDFEIIVIDQSCDKRTENYVKSLSRKNIIYRHVNFKGLSKARNVALKIANGEYCCLMDDDAYYNDTYLFEASKYAEDNLVLSGYIWDTVKNAPFVKYINNKEFLIYSVRDLFRYAPSAALVIPTKLFKKVGLFDEQFGVGARYSAGEETDFLLRASFVGSKVKYIPAMKLNHPVPIPKTTQKFDGKMEKYYEGIGALLAKHQKEYLSLSLYYIELEIKFLIKCLIKWKYNPTIVKNDFLGFNKGFHEYRRSNRK